MAGHLPPPEHPPQGPLEDRELELELSRAELLALNPFALESFSREKVRYMAAFDVETWAGTVGDLSFATAATHVAWGEGLAVQHSYQQNVCGRTGALTAQDDDALAALESRLGSLMAGLAAAPPGGHGGGSGGGFFVRLGPRSPKDAPAFASETGVTAGRIRAALEAAAEHSPPPTPATPRDALHLYQTACNLLLRVETAAEAMVLLTASARVMGDVSHTLDHGEAGWSVSAVVRAWDPAVVLSREFRVAVVRGRATAITQYDDQLCHPFARDHGAEVVAAIVEALERLRPALAVLGLAGTCCVVDFAVVPAAGGGGHVARMIELNPFGPVTGASLFNWQSERRLLQGGEDVYGDLAEWEAAHPPSTASHVGPVVEQQVIAGIPYRCLREHPPGLTWAHLSAMWADYDQLAHGKIFTPAV